MGDLKPESLTDREHPDANAVGNSLRKASLLGFRLERIPRKKGIPIGPIGTECGGEGGDSQDLTQKKWITRGDQSINSSCNYSNNSVTLSTHKHTHTHTHTHPPARAYAHTITHVHNLSSQCRA